MTFTWNESKAKRNLQSHNITFEEAAKALLSPYVQIVHDKEHSTVEEM